MLLLQQPTENSNETTSPENRYYLTIESTQINTNTRLFIVEQSIPP